MLISIKVYFGDDMEDEPFLQLIAPFGDRDNKSRCDGKVQRTN
jgi:hypothetical protein